LQKTYKYINVRVAAQLAFLWPRHALVVMAQNEDDEATEISIKLQSFLPTAAATRAGLIRN